MKFPTSFDFSVNRFQLLATALAVSSLFAMQSAEAIGLQTEPLNVTHFGHTATRLLDGRVLIAGGETATGRLDVTTNKVEVFDRTRRAFTLVAPMRVARTNHGSVALADGRVLVLGGKSNGAVQSSAEIYDPVSNSWSAVGSMAVARAKPTALRLADGRVMVVGGGAQVGAVEIFDPATNQFTATGALQTSRAEFSAAVLADGRVLVAGGRSATDADLASAEIWDPVSGTWAATGALKIARSNATATLLGDGRIMLVGGAYRWSEVLAATEIYNPVAGTFSAGPSLLTARRGHAAVTLADGKVLALGGTGTYSRGVTTIEQYDPALGYWREVGSTLTWMRDATGTALASGREVLMAGGIDGNVGEVFDPICAAVPNPVSPTSFNFPQSGGQGRLTINLPADCGWRLARLTNWITVSGMDNGVGSATVDFTVAPFAPSSPYHTGRGQTGLLNEATISIQQSVDPSPTDNLSPVAKGFGAQGGSGSVKVTVPNPRQQWTVGPSVSWVSFLSQSGTGTGSVSYTVQPNYGPARSTVVSVNSKNFTISQGSSTPACDAPKLAVESREIVGTGGAGSLRLTTGAGCPWTVSNVPSWITLKGPGSGQGSVDLNYEVAANGTQMRTAVLTIAGQQQVVQQLGNSLAR